MIAQEGCWDLCRCRAGDVGYKISFPNMKGVCSILTLTLKFSSWFTVCLFFKKTTCGPNTCIQMQVLHTKSHTTKSQHVSKCCLLCTYFWYMDVSLVMLCLTHEVTTLCFKCYKCTISSNRLLKSCHSIQNSPSILHDPYMYVQLIWILKNVCISSFMERKIPVH